MFSNRTHLPSESNRLNFADAVRPLRKPASGSVPARPSAALCASCGLKGHFEFDCRRPAAEPPTTQKPSGSSVAQLRKRLRELEAKRKICKR